MESKSSENSEHSKVTPRAKLVSYRQLFDAILSQQLGQPFVQPLQDPPNSLSDRQALAVDDLGFLSGVVMVDRLRTVRGVPLDVEEHVKRFQHSCQAVGIELPNAHELILKVNASVAQHRSTFAPQDFSVVMLATPGRIGSHPPQPTLMFQAVPIDWSRLAGWYRDGQSLCISTYRNIPAACWSPAIKTRARLQYYLADQQAQLEMGNALGAAVLLDTDGYLTETSAANVLIVEDERLVSPRPEKILNGISLKRTQRLARQLGYPISEEDISVERAQQSDAIVLCGSTGCLWTAAMFEERLFCKPIENVVYSRLSAAWKKDIALDYVEQALTYSACLGPKPIQP